MYNHIFLLYAQIVAMLQIDFRRDHFRGPLIVLAPYEETVWAGRAEP